MSDDRLGRALDRLFEADRAALLTEVVLAVAKRFAVQLQASCITTAPRLPSAVSTATDARRAKSGQRAPAITYGYSKDHRPDLKQLLFILTTDADGGVPVQFRTADGNTNDSITHIETWTTLRAVAGRADFLYVADSKLCSHDNLSFIDRAGGRFVTVLPRSRREDKHFRKLPADRDPGLGARSGIGPTLAAGMGRATSGLSTAIRWARRKGSRLIWVWSTLLTLRQQARRHRNIATATEALTALRRRILGAAIPDPRWARASTWKSR